MIPFYLEAIISMSANQSNKVQETRVRDDYYTSCKTITEERTNLMLHAPGWLETIVMQLMYKHRIVFIARKTREKVSITRLKFQKTS